jgi:isopenicillin N synthase-like dioxygenase
MTGVSLPVLDIAVFREGTDGARAAAGFVDALRETCHHPAFFYLVGHGIAADLNADVHAVTREFFALPDAERMAIRNIYSPQFRGYTPVGHEYTGGHPDRRDELDIGHEMPPPQLGPTDPAWLRLRGPNQWPAALPRLRTVLEAWMAEMEQLGRTLLRALALALGQPREHFTPLVTPRPEVLVKLIRYPARDPGQTDGQGVGDHRDTGFLSFVHQDDAGGLQVRIDDEYVDVEPVPGAFVVNLGEMLQLLTHGYFAATVHRVVSPPAGTERISVAYFFNPRLEATLAPLELPADLAAAAPGGASDDPTNPILANYGDNSLKVRLRAHPDVAQRHHADLVP